ncbi:MAG: ABC transporter permease subunit, partial [Bacilli bacterium]|nr:ABC transporter permease subunit [Bacilli bacterium]
MILKRELKVNFKSFLIWTGILIVLFLAVFLVYPSIMSSENVEMLNEMMKVFPEEMLKAFNMDIATMDSAFGYLKTEGMVFIALLVGIYAATLGGSILLKEEDDKTIEYLNTLPIKRRSVLLQKVVCSLIYIILLVVCV